MQFSLAKDYEITDGKQYVQKKSKLYNLFNWLVQTYITNVVINSLRPKAMSRNQAYA